MVIQAHGGVEEVPLLKVTKVGEFSLWVSEAEENVFEGVHAWFRVRVAKRPG